MSGKRILLIIAGGIAAYKSLDLIRRLRERGHSVRAVLTKSGAQFVTPLSVAALTGEKIHNELFSLTDEAEMGHIELSRSADLLVVAPATADLMAKMAHGLADDLASTLLLATDKPVLIAPAMNVRMWQHAATQRNITTLESDGIYFVGPDNGAMACGEFGPGRMAEPMAILAEIEDILQGEPKPGPLAGQHFVITSGPTHEPIDPVRYIANRSSGKQGHALARAAIEAGASVTLISGPVNLPDPAGAKVVHIETARQMLDAVEATLPADVFISAAAVADWRVANEGNQKLKKDASGATPALHFAENPDILATIARRAANRPRLVVGFAAETEKVIEHAREKLARKGCDFIVANDVSPASGVFGGERNAVHVVTLDAVVSWPEADKDAVARALIAHIATLLAGMSA